MRVALVVGSAYEKNAKLAAIPSAAVDTERVARRLSALDAGFKVLRFEAERGLGERIEQRLLAQTEPLEELLVYFSGYSVLSEERGPALLLDGDRLGTFSLKRLKNLVSHFAARSCLVVDAAAVVDADQRLEEVTDAIGRTLTDDSPGIEALISVRSSEAPDSLAGSPFTGALFTALDWLATSRNRREPIDLRRWFAGVRADEQLFKGVPAASLFGGIGARVAILPAAIAADSEDALPSFENSAAFESALPSFEGSTRPKVPHPSLEDGVPVFGAPAPPEERTPKDPALPRFEDSAPSDETPPRFDDRTNPQVSLPRFDDLTTPEGKLPRFDDTPSAESALPRFEEATTLQDPRFEETTSPSHSLPRFEESHSLPRFEETSAASLPLPAFDESIAAASSLPRFDERSVTSSNALPRFEIPDGPVSDLDTLLGLHTPREPAQAPSTETPAQPALDDPEPTTQPGGPFEPKMASTTARPEPVLGALPAFTTPSFAEELLSAGRLEDAVSEYEAALTLSEAPHERTSLIAGLSRVLAKLGRPEQAAQRFSEASERDPAHPDVLCVRAEWAEAALDFQNVLHTVEAWLAVQPDDPRPQAFFARAAEALGDAPKAFETWSNLGHSVKLTSNGRAEALSNASRIAETQLKDVLLAENLAGEALVLAPGESALRQRACELFSKSSQPERLFLYFEHALERVSDRATLSRLVDEIETYARGLGRPDRAGQVLERAAFRHPSDVSLRDRLTELYAAAASPRDALVHCRAVARLLPTRAVTYRRAQALFQAAGIPDGAWNAASVLECLGEADINEALFASQHKPEGLLAARNMVADEQWPSGLLSEDRDAEFEAVLSALDLSAVRAGIGLLKHKKRSIELDPALKEDPDRSTTMLAKTLGWTSRLLGMTPPSLYILPELASNLDVAPSEEPGALVSRELGSGLSLGQLAFLWGRHLTRFRSELRVLSFFRSPDELSSLLRAALALGGVLDIEARELEGDARRLHGALRREVRGSALERLESAARRFPLEEIEPRSRSALRGLELAAVRAGLLACGDVVAAAELLQRFPESGVTDTDEQLAELYAFSISEPYEWLRVRIGVAIAA